eukprot:jgi/Botrbrau1/6276/Bobra.0129s0021.1
MYSNVECILHYCACLTECMPGTCVPWCGREPDLPNSSSLLLVHYGRSRFLTPSPMSRPKIESRHARCLGHMRPPSAFLYSGA